MDQLEQNQVVMRDDIDSMKAKMDKLLELFQAMAAKKNTPRPEENTEWPQAVPVSAHQDVESAQMYRALEERLK
ncbi:hypothetical protein A2U01_0087596, partial [Trifolium medium]|nr:hypothetical protein [Trifolium medium]